MIDHIDEYPYLGRCPIMVLHTIAVIALMVPFFFFINFLSISPQMVQMQRTIAERKCQPGDVSFHISMYLVSQRLTMTYKNIYNNAQCRTSSVFHNNLDNDNDLQQPLPLATSFYSQYKLVVSLLVSFQHNRLMAFISPAALLMITILPPQDGHRCEWYIFLSIQS